MGIVVASVLHCPTVPDCARSVGAADDSASRSPIRPTPARAVQPQPSGAASVRMNPPCGCQMVHMSNQRCVRFWREFALKGGGFYHSAERRYLGGSLLPL